MERAEDIISIYRNLPLRLFSCSFLHADFNNLTGLTAQYLHLHAHKFQCRLEAEGCLLAKDGQIGQVNPGWREEGGVTPSLGQNNIRSDRKYLLKDNLSATWTTGPNLPSKQIFINRELRPTTTYCCVFLPRGFYIILNRPNHL